MSPRAAYGARIPREAGGGVVSAIEPGSPAARGGLNVGDVLVAVDGEALRDVIDWQWRGDGPAIDVEVAVASAMRPRSIEPAAAVTPAAAAPATRTVHLTRQPGELWGISFADTVFDGVRTCRNRCAFCFMAQLPKGLRRALYLRDDDFRLSFLQGNFVTLTNLSDADLGRIAEQHLSPLYVSLHSVDPAVREELVCAKEDRALERFDDLLGAGIEFHVQIVLVPGVNDAEQLEASLTWLAEREGVLSVGVVPLGYTSHQSSFAGSYEAADAAREVISQVAPWQAAFRERDGITWVYLADEFYLNAQTDVPASGHYDGYPQYENGIGLVRSFADEIADVAPQLADAVSRLPRGSHVTLLSGTMFAPVLDRLLAPIDPHALLRVLPVPNEFFGGNVSVTGLLTGGDILAALTSLDDGDPVFVPSIVANADGLLLDDVPASELGMRSGKDVRLLSCDAGGLLGGIRELAEAPPHT